MKSDFDPYHQWLGIAPEEQPPHHYRLLGLKLLEADRGVIGNAADRQMAHVKTFQSGPRAKESQRMLNELAAASNTLLNPTAKEAYDTVLKSAMPADSMSESGTAAKPTAQPNDKLEFGSYVVLEQTSAGALGVTYKVQHKHTGRFFSLKTLPAKAAANTEVVKRLRREIDIVTKLDHENLITGIDAGEVNGIPYLVTEFVSGMDLGTLVKHHGPLPIKTAAGYVAQAARGLTQLHFVGVIHRNLKPQTLFVDMQGRVRITNLLLARINEDSSLAKGEELTQMGEMMGTAEYQSPEQITNAAGVDGRADIYSLGCTLFFLLTGQPPYPGKSLMEKLMAHRQKPIPSLTAARPEVPAALDAIFQRMLAKDPAQRPAFVGEIADQLERIAPREAAQAKDGRPTLGSKKKSLPIVAITIAAVAFAAILALLMFLRP